MSRCATCHRRLEPGNRCPADGYIAPTAAAGPLPAAEPAIPGYRIDQLLGRGGFASVWAASRDGDPVAIKVAHAAGDVAAARFAVEAEALAAIGAPVTPRLFEIGALGDGRPYLVMQRMGGPTLAQQLGRAPGPPEPMWSLDVGAAIAGCVAAAHALAIVHRDLKPDNLFLAAGPDEPLVRLADFGIARALGRSAPISRAGLVLGSAEYMAPEQLAGADAAPAADIYSLGVILFELLTLRVPFPGEQADYGHRSLRPPRLSTHVAVAPVIEEIVLGCLAKQPERRPSAAQLGDQLADARRSSATGQVAFAVRRTTTLLAEARQPVVLVAARLPSASADIDRIVAPLRGSVARRRATLAVCAFCGPAIDDPIASAITAAHALVRAGAAVAIHVASLRVRAGGDGSPRVYGAEVERAEDWLPANPWQGVIATLAVRPLVPPEQIGRAAIAGFFELRAGDAPQAATAEPVLIGRQTEIDAITVSLDRALGGAGPGLFTIWGERGLGKTRLARECARLARQHRSSPRVIELGVARRGAAEPDDTAARLASALDLAPDQMLGDGIRRIAAGRPLAIVLDDLPFASDPVLDALEYAALDGRGVSLWLAVAAHPRLAHRRPSWGARAHDAVSTSLAPLAEPDAMALAARLLEPAEYLPGAILRQLAGWAGGNPASLADAVQILVADGMVRRRAGTGSYYLATGDLARLPTSPVEQWMASRALASLSPDLAACARVCAVLGVDFSSDELAAVQAAADLDGSASMAMDIDVGLTELEALGIVLRRDHGAVGFCQPALQDAIYKLLSPADRTALHRHALDHWQRRDDAGSIAGLTAIARHAEAVDAREPASVAQLQLADAARAAHDYTAADRHYSAALGLVSSADQTLAALAGRGSVRYRVQRHDDALADLAAACELARAAGDREAELSLLLEQATALDWADRFAAADDMVADASSLAAAVADPGLAARHAAARGRSAWRQQRVTDAVAALEQAVDGARSVGDGVTEVEALLLLAPALVFDQRLDEAARRFDEVIARCERTGDQFHLATALCNRSYLWSAQQATDAIVADLDRAVQLAREGGQPVLERAASHNLAEFLFWSGDDERSLDLARRADALRERFVSGPGAADALLLARIHAGRGERDPASEHWQRAREAADDSPVHQILGEAIERWLTGADAAAWQPVIDRALASLPGEEALEVIHLAARSTGVIREELSALLAAHPIWTRRFARLRN